MSRAVRTDHEFDKQKFADLLKLAAGRRTQVDFAHDCNLSISHLNRYFNAKKDTPPTPSAISQIAEAAENDVSFDSLMDAAGYDPSKHDEVSEQLSVESIIIPSADRFKTKRLYLYYLLSNFANCNFSWSTIPREQLAISNNEGENVMHFDWGIELDDITDIKYWYFKIKSSQNRSLFLEYLKNLYGCLSLCSFTPDTMFSIIVATEEEFDYIKENPPLMLNIHASVILLDSDRETFVKEEYLKTALPILKDKDMVHNICNMPSSTNED